MFPIPIAFLLTNVLLEKHIHNTRQLAKSVSDIKCLSMHPSNLVSCEKNITRSCSEGNQDHYVNKLYMHKCGGIFIELGATDGKSESNTKAMEEEMSWSGFCIEPNIDLYESLIQNRPKCKNLNAVITNSNDSKYVYTDNAGFNGLEKYINWNKLSTHNVKVKEIRKVQSYTLQDLLGNHSISLVDFLSLDVEGGEHSVLNTIDFQKISFGVLLVENGWKPNIFKLLSSNGYKLIDQVFWDAVYVNSCLNIAP
jgi:FkbM family methyltransferase